MWGHFFLFFPLWRLGLILPKKFVVILLKTGNNILGYLNAKMRSQAKGKLPLSSCSCFDLELKLYNSSFIRLCTVRVNQIAESKQSNPLLTIIFPPPAWGFRTLASLPVCHIHEQNTSYWWGRSLILGAVPCSVGQVYLKQNESSPYLYHWVQATRHLKALENKSGSSDMFLLLISEDNIYSKCLLFLKQFLI